MAGSAFTQKLLQLPICRGLTEAEVKQVFDTAEEESAKKGAWLFREGAAGDTLFIVLDGTVEVTKQLKDGSQQPLARLGDGSVLGEMSLLNGNAARSASALAATDVRMLKLTSVRFAKLMKA